jgi:hypothetical protein
MHGDVLPEKVLDNSRLDPPKACKVIYCLRVWLFWNGGCLLDSSEFRLG